MHIIIVTYTMRVYIYIYISMSSYHILQYRSEYELLHRCCNEKARVPPHCGQEELRSKKVQNMAWTTMSKNWYGLMLRIIDDLRGR